MSYTKITIEGKEVGVRFAYPCIRWFSEANQKNNDVYFMPDSTSFTVEGLAKLVQCSYWNDCLVKELEKVLPYETFFNWVEELHNTDEGQVELQRLVGIYAESSIMKKVIDEQKKSQMQTEDLTLTKSNPSASENLELDPGT